MVDKAVDRKVDLRVYRKGLINEQLELSVTTKQTPSLDRKQFIHSADPCE